MRKRGWFFVWFALSLSMIPQSVPAQGTDFTYQGRLLFGGEPANGSHDFEFLLWDADADGNQIGSTVTLTEVNVNNGVFSVRIDFGNQFPGANRFLEIRVRPSGSGAAFTGLAPRQAISSAPYAIKSINAENATMLGGLASNQFVATTDSRLDDARTPLPNSPSYVQNSTTEQPASNFNISGNGTVGNTLSAFTVDAVRYNLSGHRILWGAPSFNILFLGNDASGSAVINNAAAIGPRAFVEQSNSIVLGSVSGKNGATATSRVGIGTTTPSEQLHVAGNGLFTGNLGIGVTAPAARAHIGGSSSSITTPIAILQSSGSQTPLAFHSSDAEVARIRADSLGNLVLSTLSGANKDIYLRAGDDSNTDLFVDATTGNVGIGTTTPLSRLSVVGGISLTGRIALGNLDGSSTHLCYDTTTKEIASCSSSARYKTNINSLSLGLDLIRRLRPVSFTWKSNKSADFGLIAEEVAEVEPLLTFKNDRGDIEGVNYDGVGVVLVNAVNEQQQQIEAQRKQLDQQAETIRRQQADLDALKKLVCAQNPRAEVCQSKQ